RKYMRPRRKRTYTPTLQVKSFISRSPNVEFLGMRAGLAL
ncbi:unnamed protein product, partial [Rotaria socialis]